LEVRIRLVFREDGDPLAIGMSGGHQAQAERHGHAELLEGEGFHCRSPVMFLIDSVMPVQFVPALPRVTEAREQTSSTVTPVASGCQLTLMVSRFMPFSTSVRMMAPTSVPDTRPTPPNREVPPISTAAMAGNVRASPISPSAEFSRARKTRLARPAIAPLIM